MVAQSRPFSTFSSRKFLLTLLSMGIVTTMAVLSIFFAGIQGVLPTFVGGLLGILSLYFTGNVMNKYVVNKTIHPITEPTIPTSEEEGAQE